MAYSLLSQQIPMELCFKINDYLLHERRLKHEKCFGTVLDELENETKFVYDLLQNSYSTPKNIDPIHIALNHPKNVLCRVHVGIITDERTKESNLIIARKSDKMHWYILHRDLISICR